MLDIRPTVGTYSHLSSSVHLRPKSKTLSALLEKLNNTPPEDIQLDSFEDDDVDEWNEEDVVYLHWRMLQEIASLSNPGKPLIDKIDTLRWIFSDPERDKQPFSFVNCLKVVGCSPLSPLPYIGCLDVEEIRQWIKRQVRAWFAATISRYPEWVKNAILDNPDWIEEGLSRNPQWINEEIKRRTIQRDLFV